MSAPRSLSIDYSKIDFPTDRLTFGQIRRYQPEWFHDESKFLRRRADFIRVMPALAIEMTLANKAFAAAIGQPDPSPREDRLDYILALNRDYQAYGISSGLQHTRQLVRAFENQAAQQAKASRSPLR